MSIIVSKLLDPEANKLISRLLMAVLKLKLGISRTALKLFRSGRARDIRLAAIRIIRLRRCRRNKVPGAGGVLAFIADISTNDQ